MPRLIKGNLWQSLKRHQQLRIETVASTAALQDLQNFTLFLNPSATRYGLCSWDRQEVELHPTLYAPGMERHLFDTLMHEVAHALAYPMFADRGHGAAWQVIAHRLGATPQACGPRWGIMRQAEVSLEELGL